MTDIKVAYESLKQSYMDNFYQVLNGNISKLSGGNMNVNLSLGYWWTLTLIYDEWRRLFPHEVAALWGEATGRPAIYGKSRRERVHGTARTGAGGAVLWLRATPADRMGWVPAIVLAALAQVERLATDITEVLDELEQAVSASLGTMNFYFGPNSRTGVSRESENEWRRIAAACDAARAVLSARVG